MSELLREQLFVTFVAKNRAPVRVLMNDPPRVTAGGARWESVQRPRRPSMTIWRGRDPIEQTVGVLFDGYASGVDQTRDIDALDRLQNSSDNGSAPPQVRVIGAIRRRDIDFWIVLKIDWGTNILKDIIDGSVVTLRQDAVVTIQEYIPPDQLPATGTQAPKTQSKQSGGKNGNKFATVQPGDTLLSIAVAQYGTVDRWRDIATVNNIRDPNSVVAGSTLRLP